MRRFEFTDDEYNKLSLITGVPMYDLQKLDTMKLLANDTAVRLVFEYEYKLQKEVGGTTPRLIISAIANKYGLSVAKVRKYLFAKTQAVKFCTKCHNEVGYGEYKRNHGLCDQCAIDNITL